MHSSVGIINSGMIKAPLRSDRIVHLAEKLEAHKLNVDQIPKIPGAEDYVVPE